MTKHAFLEGMGLGVVAGAAIGIARGLQVRLWSRHAPHGPKGRRRMDRMKDQLEDRMGF